jgi:hypothetical protein
MNTINNTMKEIDDNSEREAIVGTGAVAIKYVGRVNTMLNQVV